MARSGAAGADAAQSRRAHADPDGLTRCVGHGCAVVMQRVRWWKPRGMQPVARVRVACDLSARQQASDQGRPRVVAQVFRAVWPSCDERAEVLARRRDALIEVQDGEAPGWTPAPPMAPGAAGGRADRAMSGRRYATRRVRRESVPAGVPSWLWPRALAAHALEREHLAAGVQQPCAVSPRTRRSVSESPPRAGTGLRTTAGIRSCLR